MVSKIVNDVKYFFERLFDRDGKPLLMMCIIGVVLAVLEVIFFLFIIRNATKLNIPFLLIYTYFLYFFNRFLLRAIQFGLTRFNILKYQEDNYNYSEDDMTNSIRRYNSSVYIKERDRYEATIVYIVILIIFYLIVLTFVLEADNVIKLIITLLILVPFLIMLKEPYEIITIDVNDEDKNEMTKKDFVEDFLDQIFKEKQILSPLELPSEDPEPNIDYTEQQYYEQEQQYYNQLNQEQYQEYQQGNQAVDYPQYQNSYSNPNNNQDINDQIDNQQITNQWWQQ